jgi:hypothetical protein
MFLGRLAADQRKKLSLIFMDNRVDTLVHYIRCLCLNTECSLPDWIAETREIILVASLLGDKKDDRAAEVLIIFYEQYKERLLKSANRIKSIGYLEHGVGCVVEPRGNASGTRTETVVISTPV